MPLDASFQRIDPQTAAVVFSGPLTLGTNLKSLDAQVQTLLDSGVTRLAVDLAASPYADSAGLGTLIHTAGLLAQKGGVMRLAGVSDRVRSMLRMTRTEPLFTIDADLPASLAALADSNPTQPQAAL